MTAMYFRLLRKEWRQTFPMTALLVGLGMGSAIFWLWRDAAAPLHPRIAFLVQLLALGLVPVWALWQGYRGFRQEWSGNQSYLLLSLPVPGWYFVTTKILVIWAGILLYGAVVGGGALYVLHGLALQEQLGLPPEDMADFAALNVAMVGRPIVYGLLASMGGALVAQWTWLSGRLVSRWNWVVGTVGFFLACWFVLRVGTLTGRLLGEWIPSMIFFQRVDWNLTPHVPGFNPVVTWANTGVALGMLIAGVLIFLASSWVVEHEAEL